MSSYSRAVLIKVAEMYFYQGISQKDIATDMGISTASVSRLIKEGFDLGVIRVDIRYESGIDLQLEERIRSAFGLDAVSIVETPSKVNENAMKKYLGQRAKETFVSLLKPDMNVGIGAGNTMAELVASLKVGEIPFNINPFPLVGGWNSRRAFGESNNIIQTMCNSLRCSFNALLSPAFFSSREAKEILLTEPEVKRVTDMWNHLDLVVFAVGPSLNLSNHRAFYPEILPEDITGDLLGWPINMDGSLASLECNERMMSIPLDALTKIPMRIGIGGGKAKCLNIISALKGGYITHLVVDNETAKYISKELELDCSVL